MFERSRSVTLSFGEVGPADIAALTPEQYAEVAFIDVREPHEWVGELGHIAGVHRVPLQAFLRSGPLKGNDPALAVVMICRSGRRSAFACGALAFAGFTNVFNLAGGMIAWNQAGLDVTREP